MTNTIRVNGLPAITWHRLRMNDAQLDFPTNAVECPYTASLPLVTLDREAISLPHTGGGEALREMLDSLPAAIYCADSSDTAEDLLVQLQPTEFASVFRLHLHVQKEQHQRVYLQIHPNTASTFLAVQVTFQVEDGGQLELFQCQLPGKGSTVVYDQGGVLGAQANAEIHQLFLGNDKVYGSSEVHLVGNESNLSIDQANLGKEQQQLDFNYNAVHEGKSTLSQLSVKGILDDDAQKLFRGTIDFVRGCSQSEGGETEDVLLLGDGVVNKTIPLILCGEEDVKGSHGASIGQLDDDILFYLSSRGIDEETARRLMAHARLDSVLIHWENEELKQQIETALAEVME